MKKLFLILTFLNGCFLLSFGQDDYTVKGSVVDTSANIKLHNTSVSILTAQDSMLYKYTRADNNGNFLFDGLEKGDYILLVTYPKYADYVEQFSLDSVKEINFGSMNMILKSQLLEEVIITGRQAITIKGDTTEYDAASFTLQPNAKVEDLLKQLPGIQVDQDGKITAQGQTVNKVLVDGEEFFGDDPTLVTKNLRGDMVDKVQLYDKQNDQAAFTGVDDGEKEKTINIQLKEDSKKGYFGKVDAGAGTNDFYQGQAMFNKFKGKEKFSAYGTLGNTGKVGLGWQDADRYANSGGMEMNEDGDMMFYSSGGDDFESFNGQYNGQGIPSAYNGGLHYDNKWDEDKHGINANYKLGSLGVEGTRNSIAQHNLPSGTQNRRSDQYFDNHIFRQKLDVRYDWKIDSTTNLRITIDGTLRNSSTDDEFSSTTTNGNDMLLNESVRKLTNEGNDRIFNANVLLTKRLKKPGRTISLNLRQSINESKTEGFLNAENSFYDGVGGLDSIQQVNQYKDNDIVNNAFQSNLTYSEPIFKDFKVVFNYGLSVNNGSANRQSFNQSATGEYNLLDSLFSNNYQLNQLSNQVGAVFNYKKNKNNLTFGTKISDVRFKQLDLYNNETFTRNFMNLNPQVTYQYRFSQQKTLRFNYFGNNTQPSIDQIQPIRINNDPLNIFEGNPDLRPSFTNRFNLNYYSYKVLTDQYISFYGGYSFTTNPIVNNTFTDATGKTVYRSANLRDRNTMNFNGGIYGGQKIKKWDLRVGGDLSTNGNVFYNLTNDSLNMTKSYSYSARISISQYKQKKYDFGISGGPTYNTSVASLQPELNNNGWGFNGDASFNIYLPGKIQLGADGNYMFTQATQSFDEHFERLIVNARVTKRFLKEENLMFTVSANDLLNQNVGFNRSAFNNSITQDSYTTIRRFFMFSVIWEFNKMGGAGTQ
ncbi:outer membrane beta-barrel protein [Olivibacter sp. SDN3]|uniref:outer membrane beta-barrel family protein n=1 Tax=Olivibacter sp. SDN3 TaxID=2764720 RepID=UPI00165172E1|nr:outer membrane beta-barrel family protein [Olivibacter sp. SDN3]QNL49547.1 outer membrane beta-barrel protein [Olivibacter sp. SDN3]